MLSSYRAIDLSDERGQFVRAGPGNPHHPPNGTLIITMAAAVESLTRRFRNRSHSGRPRRLQTWFRSISSFGCGSR
jgi:hypothetical protein